MLIPIKKIPVTKRGRLFSVTRIYWSLSELETKRKLMPRKEDFW